MKTESEVKEELENLIKERDAYISIRDGYKTLTTIVPSLGYYEGQSSYFNYLITENHIKFNKLQREYENEYSEFPTW